MSLHHVTEEEGHEAGEDLVVLTPGPGRWRLEVEKQEGVLTTDDNQNGEQLQVRDQLSHTPVEGSGRVVLALDADVRVHLADGLRVILEDFTVTSGDTVLEPQYGAAVDRRLSGLSRFRVREDGRVVGRLVPTLRARPSNINVPEGERREEEQGRQKASLAVLRHDCSSLLLLLQSSLTAACIQNCCITAISWLLIVRHS